MSRTDDHPHLPPLYSLNVLKMTSLPSLLKRRSVVLSIFVFASFVLEMGEGVKMHFAVSSHRDLESNYMELKRLTPTLKNNPEETLEAKRNICRIILSSHYFFDEHGLQPMADDESSQHTNNSHAINLQTNATKSYAVHPVAAGRDVFLESVFPCTAWNRLTRSAEKYYVSREYLAWYSETRFVFTYNENKKAMNVVAMAEEPAKTKWFFSQGYLFSSSFGMDAVLHKLEPLSVGICHFNDAARFRLCATVLSSEKYRDKIKFPSSHDKRVPTCEHRELILKWQYAFIPAAAEGKETSFTEWVVKCEAMHIGSATQISFYVSLGFYKDMFFISRELGGQIRVINVCNVPHMAPHDSHYVVGS